MKVSRTRQVMVRGTDLHALGGQPLKPVSLSCEPWGQEKTEADAKYFLLYNRKRKSGAKYTEQKFRMRRDKEEG